MSVLCPYLTLHSSSLFHCPHELFKRREVLYYGYLFLCRSIESDFYIHYSTNVGVKTWVRLLIFTCPFFLIKMSLMPPRKRMLYIVARLCQTCGEEYVDEEIAIRLLQIAEDASQAGVQIDVRRYVAA